MQNRLMWTVWALLGLVLTYLTTLSIDVSGQLIFAVLLIATLLILKQFPHVEVFRYTFLFLAVFSSVRYFFWRTTATLTGFSDIGDFIGTILLYTAEVYSIVILLLSTFTNIRIVTPRVSPPLPLNPDTLPSVDILIPSYDEPLDMVEISLIGALNQRYPADKINVYLLDDGSSEERRFHSDPQISQIATERYQQSQALCEKLGVTLLTRKDNQHAKAGNLNAALKQIDGQLVLVLDADHVATVDFLERTVGFFLVDPKMAIVQTPHFFINPDPVEKNLQIFRRLPSESEMFYFVVQPGLDSWGSSFFCGSAGIISRESLDAVGGFSTRSITEDADTSLLIHAEGYHSAYVSNPMISGLQPESYASYVRQRTRWTQGMIQILLLDNPLFKRGLSISERLCYFSNVFFWLFPYARVIFIISPMLYLVFGFKIYNADLRHFLSFALPHIVVVFILSSYLFGKVRWTFASELYELMQSTFALPAIFRVMRNPKAPKFKATPKGEIFTRDYLSKQSIPFYILYLCTVLAMIFGIWRFVEYPLERNMVVVTMIWAIFNWLTLNGAIGALYERRQRRANPRMPANVQAALVTNQGEFDCHIVDLSSSGALAILPAISENCIPDQMSACQLRIYNRVLARDSFIPVELKNKRVTEEEKLAVGLCFALETVTEKAEAVLLVHGDSDRWQAFLDSRIVHPGFLPSFMFFTKLGLTHAGEHFAAGIRLLTEYILNRTPKTSDKENWRTDYDRG